MARTLYLSDRPAEALKYQIKMLTNLDKGYLLDDDKKIKIEDLYSDGYLFAKKANSKAMEEFVAENPLKVEQLSQDTGKKGKVKKVSRNDPCPCGSGKKYKRCCGR